jgi:hypothetical protein
VTSSTPILRIDFTLAPEVDLGTLSFGVAFTDVMGITTTDAILLDVVAPDTSVKIGLAEFLSDTNGDGALSPGESATVNVFAENVGSADAIGVYAKLISSNPNVLITSCVALTGADVLPCDLACSCQQIPSDLKATLVAGEISSDVILSINFDVLSGAPLQSLPFIIEFTDIFQNTWIDTFSLDLVTP